MVHPIHRRRPVVFVLSLLSVVLTGTIGVGASPNTVTSPIVTAVVRNDAPYTILVTGEGFTPAGRVYVALYDHTGAGPEEIRLAGDTLPVSGKNNSADPAAESGRAVAFGAAIGDWLSASATVYGRDNSADPAAGFSPGGTIGTEFLIPCGIAVAVRAFDQSTASWSNWVAVHTGCEPKSD